MAANENLNDKLWFRPKFSRQDCETFLAEKPVGAFIVRGSSQQNCLALSHMTPEHEIGSKLFFLKNLVFSPSFFCLFVYFQMSYFIPEIHSKFEYKLLHFE
jgi:hypothetical protein